MYELLSGVTVLLSIILKYYKTKPSIILEIERPENAKSYE